MLTGDEVQEADAMGKIIREEAMRMATAQFPGNQMLSDVVLVAARELCLHSVEAVERVYKFMLITGGLPSIEDKSGFISCTMKIVAMCIKAMAEDMPDSIFKPEDVAVKQ